ncbi:MAG: hypothetical protein ABWZ88_13405 [Variovorax sp.]
MKPTLAALGCILALTGATTLAQQQHPQNPGTSASSSSSGPTLTDKVKQAAQTLGEKTKETAQKIKEKAQQVTQEAKTSDDAGENTKKGAAGSSTAAAKMQTKADADFKAAKAKCGSIEEKAQKAVCQKQAAAAHANAEVKIEKAKAANHSSTSTKSSHS